MSNVIQKGGARNPTRCDKKCVIVTLGEAVPYSTGKLGGKLIFGANFQNPSFGTYRGRFSYCFQELANFPDQFSEVASGKIRP